MSEQKRCKQCSKTMTRKRYGRRLEGLKDFNGRNFCCVSCAAKFRERSKGGKDQETAEKIEAAVGHIESGNEMQIKTGVEILRELANNSKDETTRLNAAKALAPYETKKAGEQGKKEIREEAAGKASSGRFAAGPAPILPFKKRQYEH